MATIDALLGLGIEDGAETQALADSLRGRKRAADIFSLSTVGNIAKGAQAEQQSVMEGAKRGGVLRQAMADKASREEQAQLDRENRATIAGNSLTETIRNNNLRNTSTFAGVKPEEYINITDPTDSITAVLGPEGVLVNTTDGNAVDQTQYMKRNNPNSRRNGGVGDYYTPKTRAERDKLAKGSMDVSSLLDMANSFEDEYGAGPIEGPLGLGKLENWIGRVFPEGMAPDTEEEALWWSNYKKQQELVERHELFGSALTEGEQKQWLEATINPNDTASFVRKKLAEQKRLSMKIVEHEAALALRQNIDPEQVLMSYGDVVDVRTLADEVADGSYFDKLAKRQDQDRANRAAGRVGHDDGDMMSDEERELDAQIALLEAKVE